METALFYFFGVIALLAAINVVAQRKVFYSAISLIICLCAVAALYMTLEAPFIAAIQIIVYAGAIMVLFVFVIMMIAPEGVALHPRAWIGPAGLALVLLGEIAWVLAGGPASPAPAVEVGPKEVGMALFGPYLVGAEVAAFLLLSGLVGAFHLGRRR